MAFPLDADLDIIVEVYLGADPTDFPEAWPAATDLSSRLLRKPIQIRRGRGTNQKTAQAGSCTLWLDNTDGALTPLLPTSTYYPDWDLGVPIRVSVNGVGVSPPYVRHTGFVVDVTAVMVPGVPGGGNISAVRVTSAGVLRRLGQGAVEKSALKRTILASAPEAYWPLEDGDEAEVAGAAAEGPPLRKFGTVDFAAFTDLVGAVQTPDLTAGSLFGSVSGVSASAWHAEFVVKMPFTATSVVARVYANSVQAAVWRIFLPTAAGDFCQVFTTDYNGTNTLFNLVGDAVSAAFENEWHHIAITAEQSGSSIVGSLYVDGVLQDSTSGAGTLGSPYEFWANHQVTTVTSMAHIAVGSGAFTSDAAGAIDGFSGEQAHERFERVCDEEGIPFTGSASSSNECGPQPVATVVGVLQDCEIIDHGMIVEDFEWGLNYIASSQRENLAPTLTIDLATYRTTSGTQGDVLTPVRNDARLRNEWTITRPEGSSSTARDATNIAKRGRYDDSATVNVDGDDRTLDEAQWRVHEGTFDRLRYETLPLDIAANLGS